MPSSRHLTSNSVFNMLLQKSTSIDLYPTQMEVYEPQTVSYLDFPSLRSRPLQGTIVVARGSSRLGGLCLSRTMTIFSQNPSPFSCSPWLVGNPHLGDALSGPLESRVQDRTWEHEENHASLAKPGEKLSSSSSKQDLLGRKFCLCAAR